MNIIEKYIETNKPLLDDLVANDPTLAVGVIDALAVLNNYINANKIEFTEEEENKILVPATAEDIKIAETRTENELKIAESHSKEIQKAVEKIDESDLNNQPCTYVWVRDWLGNKENTYFLLGLTNDEKAESMLFGTYLQGDVFTNNPTPANKLARERFISEGRLQSMNTGIGVWLFKMGHFTIKSPKLKQLSSYTNKVIEVGDLVKQSLQPILLLQESNANGLELLVQGTNGAKLNDVYFNFDDLIEFAQPFQNINYALNTLQLVAWAEGIDLGLKTTTDFFQLAYLYNFAIKASKVMNDEIYLILTRDSLTENSELTYATSKSSAEEKIVKNGVDNSFVVGILKNGKFIFHINPYMFAKPIVQNKQNSTTLDAMKFGAKELSLKTKENVYVIQKQDNSFVNKIGEDEAYKIIHSSDFKSVLAIFKDGQEINLPLIPPPSPSPKEEVENAIIDDDLLNLNHDDMDIDLEGLDDLQDIEADLSDLDFETQE